jgi:transcription initiation factor TFIIE subunit alpha
MSTQLSEDQVTRLCQDLIYQVSYAFYDTPYILLLKLIVHLGV